MAKLRRFRLRYLNTVANAEQALGVLEKNCMLLSAFETDLVPGSFWQGGLITRLVELTFTSAAFRPPKGTRRYLAKLEILKLRIIARTVDDVLEFFENFPEAPNLKELRLLWDVVLGRETLIGLVNLRMKLTNMNHFIATPTGLQASNLIEESPVDRSNKVEQVFAKEFGQLLLCKCYECSISTNKEHHIVYQKQAWLGLPESVRNSFNDFVG